MISRDLADSGLTTLAVALRRREQGKAAFVLNPLDSSANTNEPWLASLSHSCVPSSVQGRPVRPAAPFSCPLDWKAADSGGYDGGGGARWVETMRCG